MMQQASCPVDHMIRLVTTALQHVDDVSQITITCRSCDLTERSPIIIVQVLFGTQAI